MLPTDGDASPSMPPRVFQGAADAVREAVGGALDELVYVTVARVQPQPPGNAPPTRIAAPTPPRPMEPRAEAIRPRGSVAAKAQVAEPVPHFDDEEEDTDEKKMEENNGEK